MSEHNEKIAARIKDEIARLPEEDTPVGVQQLNPGFFQMERIRDNASAKQRATVRVTMREQR